jgi:hypothetical protein
MTFYRFAIMARTNLNVCHDNGFSLRLNTMSLSRQRLYSISISMKCIQNRSSPHSAPCAAPVIYSYFFERAPNPSCSHPRVRHLHWAVATRTMRLDRKTCFAGQWGPLQTIRHREVWSGGLHQFSYSLLHDGLRVRRWKAL